MIEIPRLPIIRLSGGSDIEIKKRWMFLSKPDRVRNIRGRLKLRNDE
jgi:hypothetical protein